jgi:hypothetical protein
MGTLARARFAGQTEGEPQLRLRLCAILSLPLNCFLSMRDKEPKQLVAEAWMPKPDAGTAKSHPRSHCPWIEGGQPSPWLGCTTNGVGIPQFKLGLIDGLPGQGRSGHGREASPQRQPRYTFVCFGDENNPSMVVLKKSGTRRSPNADPLVRIFASARTCLAEGCTTRLSRYNPAPCCSLHQGWDEQQQTRPRHRRS